MSKGVKEAKVMRGKKPRKGPVKSFSLDKANNGFVSRTHRDNRDEKGHSTYEEPEQNVHESLDSVHEYIDSLFSGGDSKSRRVAAAKSMMNGPAPEMVD